MNRCVRSAMFALALFAPSTGCAQERPAPPDRWRAAILQAESAAQRGDRADATQRASAIVRAYQQGSTWSTTEHTSAGRAYVLLGTGDAAATRAALAAFDRAIAADSGNLEAQRRVGALFLDKYNAPDARAAFEAVLRRRAQDAPALLGLARVEEFEGRGTALATARRSLMADPSYADALAFVAGLQLEGEAYDSATVTAQRALRADSTSLAAWSVLGATAWLAGDSATYQHALRAATTLQPAPATFYTAIAEAAVRNRRYADAVTLAERAVALDAQSVQAWGVLGTNQLRTGRMTEGQASLDRAFQLDPFNLWHKNTLDLLDKLAGFRVIDEGRFRVVAPAEEAELLAMYVIPLLEQAFDSLSKRYGYAPPTPVRLEFYRQHADFSVRTVGLAGLGALGVSFGSLLAMDTPSARERGAFNWGSTAWHELTHAFTLGASAHRVPRWLSEGLSVLEERRVGRGWGADVTVPYLVAMTTGKLRPISQLNDGFLRPRYPEETMYSYYLASLFCEMVETTTGPAALPAMLVAYRDGLGTPAVFQRVLRMSPTQVDSTFDAWTAKKFALPLAAVRGATSADSSGGPFVAAMRAAMPLLRARPDSARVLLERAQQMFPGYSGDDGPAWYLAQIAIAAHDTTRALTLLTQITSRNETAWEANVQEAALREARGDAMGTMAALDRLLWIAPYDDVLHARFATLAASQRDYRTAIRERRAAIAAQPADLLAARYELADALAQSGDVAGARRELLQLLEEAPSFEKAQALLLSLRGRTGTAGGTR